VSKKAELAAGPDPRGSALVPSLRAARPTDLSAITEIYRHHVLHGLGTFEEEPPDLAEMTRRHAEITGKRLPYLVAERAGVLLGYAYAAPYRPRSAYRYTVEDSIYVAPGAERNGIGQALLTELIARCVEAGYRQMVAVIGDSGNAASIGLHLRHGFQRVGTIEACGYKHGRWVDSVVMQRPLGPGGNTKPSL
jgi:phosphinothricin acetyltransferase